MEKKLSDLVSNWCLGKTNSLKSGPFSALSACANEAVVRESRYYIDFIA